MTEFIAMMLLAAIAILGVAAWAYYRYSQRELERLQEYEFFSNRFFAASEALTSDADTPDVVLNVLGLLNDMVADEQASKRFLRGYALHVLEARRTGRRRAQRPELIEFARKRKELASQFADAVTSGVIAMTFLSDGWGVRARAMLADAFAREPKPTEVIDVFENVACLPHAA